jgi:hypothetical protein
MLLIRATPSHCSNCSPVRNAFEHWGTRGREPDAGQRSNMRGRHVYQLLKRGYESALREFELYERGGPASTQQAIRYEGEAIAVSASAEDCL